MSEGSCQVLHLGRKRYAEVWEMQQSLQRSLMQDSGCETLILCEHEPVITCGKSAKPENLLTPPEALSRLNIELFNVERGGDVTYHGPGQLVGYPILDLNLHRRDVHWYMRSLEEVLIRTLSHFGISGLRLEGKTGVWVRMPDSSSVEHLKLASMGVRLSKWVTLHGFAMNIADCSSGFNLINPCGFRSAEISCMEGILGKAIPFREVEERIEQDFLDVFYGGAR